LWLGLTAALVAVRALLPRPRQGPGSVGGDGSTNAGGLVGASLLGFALVAQVAVFWVLYDIQIWQGTNHLYDLNVYLGSAGRWIDGGQPYMTAPVTSWPANASSDFFLYPPPLLPFFGLLSRLPGAAVAVGWTAAMLGCGYAAFRFLGLRRPLAVLLLAFPPMMIGVESGNVANLTLLLFAAGMRCGGTLVVDGLFKVQTGLPALALVRARRWRGLLAGVAVAAAIVAATLPLTGLGAWRDWLTGLGYRAASQSAAVSLYGYSPARDLPGWLYGVICVVLVVVALSFRGRRGLAALGLASIFASPALWPHGFAFALPAVLTLESGTAVWAVLGAGVIGANMWLLFYAGFASVLAARRDPAEAIHPLSGRDGPWPRPAVSIARRREPGPVVRVGSGRPASGASAASDAMPPDRAE
jgi:Glycosyltransferase family 87